LGQLGTRVDIMVTSQVHNPDSLQDCDVLKSDAINTLRLTDIGLD